MVTGYDSKCRYTTHLWRLWQPSQSDDESHILNRLYFINIWQSTQFYLISMWILGSIPLFISPSVYQPSSSQCNISGIFKQLSESESNFRYFVMYNIVYTKLEMPWTLWNFDSQNSTIVILKLGTQDFNSYMNYARLFFLLNIWIFFVGFWEWSWIKGSRDRHARRDGL